VLVSHKIRTAGLWASGRPQTDGEGVIGASEEEVDTGLGDRAAPKDQYLLLGHVFDNDDYDSGLDQI
jgi:hypothetical protein